MFLGHGIPVSGLSQVPSAQVSTIKPQSCCQSTGVCDQIRVKFPGHRVPESSLSHVASPRVQIKRQSCSQCTGFHLKPQSCCQSTGFCNQSVQHRLQSNSHVPRPMVSRIKPQSFSQATSFKNQTSLMFPGHRVPE